MWRGILHTAFLWRAVESSRVKAELAKFDEISASFAVTQVAEERHDVTVQPVALATSSDTGLQAAMIEVTDAAAVSESEDPNLPPLQNDEAFNARFDPHGCRHFALLRWPQLSFLSQEIIRRADALPDVPSDQQREELRTFTKKMGYLTCGSELLDPRHGHDMPEYAKHILPVWEELANAPATSFEVPKLSPWFKARVSIITAEHTCMTWAIRKMCLVGSMAKRLSGSKGSNATCWSSLTYPPRARDNPFSKDPFMVVERKADPDPLGYTNCQDYPLSALDLGIMCQSYHIYAPGVPEEKILGRKVKKDPKLYQEVLKCNTKLGLPGQPYVAEDFSLSPYAWDLL